VFLRSVTGLAGSFLLARIETWSSWVVESGRGPLQLAE
jgi:hypothetical protein